MGTLKPGATYIYEKAGGVTYAREIGQSDRIVVGMDYNSNAQVVDKLFGVPVKELVPFAGLIQLAEKDPALREELDRLVTYYHLAHQEQNENVMWHPV